MENKPAVLKQQLFELLKQEAFKEGNFVLSSGKTSSYYLDGRVITLTPQGAYLISLIILDMIKDVHVTALGGPTLGADPIAGAFACVSFLEKRPLKTFIVRKVAKDHGAKRQIEGPAIKPGERVILVDDVATTGKALIEAKQVLDSLNIIVDRAIVIVDRKEGADENLRKVGVRLESIFTIDEFLSSRKT